MLFAIIGSTASAVPGTTTFSQSGGNYGYSSADTGLGLAVGLGSVVVAFFTIFTTSFIVERKLPPIEGLKASFELVKANVVPVLPTYLVVFAISFVGYLACGVGLIVAGPSDQAERTMASPPRLNTATLIDDE